MKKILFFLLFIPSIAFSSRIYYKYVYKTSDFSYYEDSTYPPKEEDKKEAVLPREQWIKVFWHYVSSDDIGFDMTCKYHDHIDVYTGTVYTFLNDGTWDTVKDNLTDEQIFYDDARKFTEDTKVNKHTYLKDTVVKFKSCRYTHPDNPIIYTINSEQVSEDTYNNAFRSSVEV